MSATDPEFIAKWLASVEASDLPKVNLTVREVEAHIGQMHFICEAFIYLLERNHDLERQIQTLTEVYFGDIEQ
jgi:hypothetical protein